jgi:hypothetical protein
VTRLPPDHPPCPLPVEEEDSCLPPRRLWGRGLLLPHLPAPPTRPLERDSRTSLGGENATSVVPSPEQGVKTNIPRPMFPSLQRFPWNPPRLLPLPLQNRSPLVPPRFLSLPPRTTTPLPPHLPPRGRKSPPMREPHPTAQVLQEAAVAVVVEGR